MPKKIERLVKEFSVQKNCILQREYALDTGIIKNKSEKFAGMIAPFVNNPQGDMSHKNPVGLIGISQNYSCSIIYFSYTNSESSSSYPHELALINNYKWGFELERKGKKGDDLMHLQLDSKELKGELTRLGFFDFSGLSTKGIISVTPQNYRRIENLLLTLFCQ